MFGGLWRFKTFCSFFVLPKNEPKKRVGRIEELAIASAEKYAEIFLKFQNSLRSNRCNLLTENIYRLFIPQSPTEIKLYHILIGCFEQAQKISQSEMNISICDTNRCLPDLEKLKLACFWALRKCICLSAASYAFIAQKCANFRYSQQASFETRLERFFGSFFGKTKNE